VPSPAPVFDTQAEDTALHQFEAQDAAVDDDDDFGIPPPPPMPPRSHDHEAGSSRATPAAPPAIDPALASILQTLTQQQAHLAPSRPVRQQPISSCPRGCSRCFRQYRTDRILFSSSFFRIGLRAGHS
jgi:hypothetical protein